LILYVGYKFYVGYCIAGLSLQLYGRCVADIFIRSLAKN